MISAATDAMNVKGAIPRIPRINDHTAFRLVGREP
jgi:hypothetical protein